MDIQALIVGVIVLVAVVYLLGKYTRAAKGRSGCGCGCDGGSGCPATKRAHCESGK